MERGREGRRGGGGGGLVHAPRRPRTGFKDAAVGDDGDDMMDDVHNSRLRERSKKDGSGVTGGHGVATSTVGPSSRNKRKRQGSAEVAVQARNSPADEVEETTEDTEMGVSEDDDDPPPPIIIPRRPGKPRPQAKFAEDGIAMDLPAVPRKARTAMGKRPHEAATPPVGESPGHGAAVAAPTPAPSSTPSSSSIASLKPGRRTKPSGSKPRGHKLAKVSSASHVSEQEVEVAEALFDLARMFTQSPSRNVESRADLEVMPKDLKPEAKFDMKVSKGSGGNLPIQPPKQSIDTSAAATADPASGANSAGYVKGVSPLAATPASPVPSPSSALTSLSEAAKRKRPRVRTRTEDGGGVQSRQAPSTAGGGGVGLAPSKDADQSSGRAATAESGVNVEKSATATGGLGASANNMAGTPSNTGGVASPSSGLGGSGTAPAAAAQDDAVGVSVGRVEKSGTEKKVVVLAEKKVVVLAEKKVVNGGGKAEGASSNSQEKRVAESSVREKKGAIGEAAGPAVAAAASANAGAGVEAAAASSSVPVGAATTTKMEVEKRSPQAVAAVASDTDHVPKRDIDLMVAPSKGDGEEKDEESGEGDVREASEKRVVDADGAAAGAAATAGVERSRVEREREREAEEKERVEMERVREKERERESERERVERDRRREVESQRELAKERERAELSKVGASRSGKSTKVENGRVQKGERAGPGTATAGSTFLGSAGLGGGGAPGATGAGVGGNVGVLPMSVRMLSWPGAMAGGMAGSLGYSPTAAAAAAEESAPAVQVPVPPYMMGPQRAAWKRCAQHVYIAHFIDMQQQLNRHQSFFTGGGGAYPKSYNLNVPLAPSESAFGGAGGGLAAGVGGPRVCSSGGPVGGGAGALEATERGLSAAAMAAAAAASMQGVKERAYSMEMMSRKSPGQHGHSGGQGVAALSLQSGLMFSIPNAQSTSPAGPTAAAGSGATGGTNLNLPPGGGGGASTAPGSSTALVLGPGAGAVGGLAGGGSGGVAASAAVQAQYMQAMMQQSGSFPFAQFPPHFGPATFGGPASHMSAQQAAQFFAAGGPYFAHHMAHSQQGGGQGSGSSGSGGAKVQGQGSGAGGSRSYGGGGSGAHGAPPQSPSHSAAAGPGAHGVVRAGEREGSTAGENGSSGESKFPMARGSALAGAGSVAVSGGVGGIATHGGVEYNLMAGLGKQAKSREQGQVKQSYAHGVSTTQQTLHQKQQLQGSGGGVLVGGKGMDGATSQGFSMSLASSANRGPSVGPGPLGLASVAAVMAPQGHAMIQSVAESGRGQAVRSPQLQLGVGSGHPTIMQQQNQHQLMQLHHAQMQHAQSLQSHQQHQVPPQQQAGQVHQLQQQRGGHNARSAAGGAEDNRGGADGSYSSGIGLGREREVLEDRKVHRRRPSGGASPLSRDAEGGGGMQPSISSTGAGDLGSSRGVETTLNLMAPSSNSIDARSSGLSASLTVAGPTQAAVVAGSKQGGGRPKGAGGPTAAAPGGPQSATQGSFTERVPLAGGAGVGMASPTQGLSLGGENMASSQGGWQGQVGQHAQMKDSQRPTPGALSGATAVPTAPGTNLQAVLAAAMAKNTQGQQSQRTAQGGSNLNASANANSGSSARMGIAMAGPAVASAGSPMLSMAPPTKSSGANAAKSSTSAQSSFPVGQKGVAGAGKRASSPSSVGMVLSMLGPNVSVQNMPSKTSQPQVQVQGQGQGKGPHQHVGVQLLSSHPGQFPSQLQQQQFHQQQQHQIMRQSMFQQHSAFWQHQQQQQSPHFHSSQPGSPHLQSSHQAPPHQQQAPQQQPTPAPQTQQISSQQQNQQQLGGPAGNGSLAFSSGLSIGAGNNSSAGGGGRNSNSEAANVPPNVRPLQSVKPAGGGSTPGANGGGQRGNGGSGAGPAFLQQQFGASVSASSGAQQSGSPRNSAPSGYSGGNTNPGAGGSEQVNGVRVAQGTAQARGAGTMASSPGMQGSSQRGQSGGAGPTKAGGGQCSGFGETGQSRTSTMVSNSSSGPQSGGSNPSGQMNSSGTNVQSVGNGRPAFNGGPLHQGPSGQGQVQTTASLGMAGAAVVPSGPAAVLGPQPTTSVVQQ